MTHLIRTFITSEGAAISVESVLIFPILLICYAGSFIYFDAFRSYNLTIKASYTIGDILSRKTSTMTNTDLLGMEKLFEFLTFGDTTPWIRISEVNKTTAGLEVTGSCATDGNPKRTINDTAGIVEFIPNLATDERIVVVETFTPYDPAFNVGVAARTWENVIVTRSRYASSLPIASLCS